MRMKVYGEIQTSDEGYRWVADGNITVHMTKHANVSGTGWWELDVHSFSVSSAGFVQVYAENVFPDEQPTHDSQGLELPIIKGQND